MTGLARPDLRFHASWASAVRELERDGTTMHGSGLWEPDTGDLGRAAPATEVERLLAQADPATQRARRGSCPAPTPGSSRTSAATSCASG